MPGQTEEWTDRPHFIGPFRLLPMVQRKVNSALSNWDIIANLKKLHSNFVIVSFDKAANNVTIKCKRLCALLIAKQLGLNSGNGNDKNGTYKL